MGYQEDFISAFSEHLHRDGAEALLAWMQTTDFFKMCIRDSLPVATMPSHCPAMCPHIWARTGWPQTA